MIRSLIERLTGRRRAPAGVMPEPPPAEGGMTVAEVTDALLDWHDDAPVFINSRRYGYFQPVARVSVDRDRRVVVIEDEDEA